MCTAHLDDNAVYVVSRHKGALLYTAVLDLLFTTFAHAVSDRCLPSLPHLHLTLQDSLTAIPSVMQRLVTTPTLMATLRPVPIEDRIELSFEPDR